MPICFVGAEPWQQRGAPMQRETYGEAVRTFNWDDVRAALGWSKSGKVSLAASIIERHLGRDAPAMIWIGKDGMDRRVSYRELSQTSSRFANVLQRHGVRPGDRVAGLMPRVPETLIAVLGALKAGAIYVPMFTGFGPDAIRFRLDHSRTSFLVTHHEVRPNVPASVNVKILCVTDASGASAPGDLDFWQTLDREPASFSAIHRHCEDVASLIYTSGSTGQPKGGAIAVNFLAAVWPYIIYGLDLRDRDVFWPTGDPGWGYGFVCYLGALALGGTLISVQHNPSPEMCLAVLERYGVTNLATTPTLLRGLMSLDEQVVRKSPSSLRAISSCGEPLNAKVVEFFQTAWNLTPMDHFGATEFALPIGNYNALDMVVKPGSMGLPSPGFRMAVIDETGRELPDGQVGLLGRASNADNRYWLRYWDDPQASHDLERNGWIVTGDLARRDEDGYFWFEGRASDMIKSAGYRIGPFEVESALLRHPAVAEAAVVGKADALRGEIVKAWIVLRPGFHPSDALSELAQMVKTNLGRHQYPRELEFIAALPKTETGKIQRFLLRQRG
jgi:acetyl-CoA synthetase